MATNPVRISTSADAPADAADQEATRSEGGCGCGGCGCGGQGRARKS